MVGRGAGGADTYGYLVHALRPVQTEETVSCRQNTNVKEVGTPPVRSNLFTSLTAVSTAVRSRVTKTMSVEQLSRNNGNKRLSSFPSPAPPPCS